MRQFPHNWQVCLCAAAAISLAVSGCVLPSRRNRPLTLGAIGGPSASANPATQPAVYDDSPWRSLLLQHVAPGWTSTEEATGDKKTPPYPALVDYKAIQAEPADLSAFMAILARTGPATTPQAFATDADRLAYYLNAYNACAIRAVLAESPVQTMYAPFMPAFEYDWYFQVDGKRVNLHDLRQLAWRAAGGDVRALFGMCCAAIGSAPLSPQPYRAQGLYDNLSAQLRSCLAMPHIVAVSHDQQQLQLWWRIVRQRKDFLDYYQKVYGSPAESLLNVLLELCQPAQRQTLNKAVGYKIVEIPFDRRLNELAVRSNP